MLANNGTTATLLSPNEMAVGKAYSQFVDDEEMSEVISGSTVIEGISGWRLPTLAELNAIYSASETANGLFESDGGTILTNARRYIYTDAYGNILARALSTPRCVGCR